MDLISREAIKKYISAPCTYVEGRRIFYEEDLDLMGSAFEGMTVGEVLKAVFPNAVIRTDDSRLIVEVLFSNEVWDSPYKGVSE